MAKYFQTSKSRMTHKSNLATSVNGKKEYTFVENVYTHFLKSVYEVKKSSCQRFAVDYQSYLKLIENETVNFQLKPRALTKSIVN